MEAGLVLLSGEVRSPIHPSGGREAAERHN